ncbi:hypothetical protein LTS18_014729, partial [Coniosporium uncinatum]
MDLTQTSQELQKIVAFEDVFNRIFKLIDAEGGLVEGGIVVQDSLALLANLVRHNRTNQDLFRETGCVRRLSQLLRPPPGGAQSFDAQHAISMWGFLAVLRLFLVQGSPGTQLNQDVFSKHGILQQVLDLAFGRDAPVNIRAEALYTCADMIRGNSKLQVGFAQHQVESATPAETSQNGKSVNGTRKVYVIDALLDLALSASSVSLFDARYAACECIKAYMYRHDQIRLHFLERAIEGHKNGDVTTNALTVLVRGSEGTDPYVMWFATVLILHLLYDDPKAKDTLMSVVEGDESSGEEVITCVQAAAGNLVAAIQRGDDERVTVAYLMLLCGWLFESADAVNDFLNEGSILQILIQTA